MLEFSYRLPSFHNVRTFHVPIDVSFLALISLFSLVAILQRASPSESKTHSSPPVAIGRPRVSPREFKTHVRIASFVSLSFMLVSWEVFACGSQSSHALHGAVDLLSSLLAGSSALLQVAFPPHARALMQPSRALIRLVLKPLALHEFLGYSAEDGHVLF